jgi:hypothetical protein
MKNLLFLIPFIFGTVRAQDPGPGPFENLPLVISLNFNAISTPFHKLQNNFRNIGIRIGTEIALNRKQNLLQSLNFCYYRNRQNGDGIFINSEFTFRPEIFKGANIEFKIGPGVAQLFFPSPTLVPDGSGGWKKQGMSSKTTFQVHTGFGVGYSGFKLGTTEVSPFLNYEIVGLAGYNRTIPVLPTSFIQTGTRLKF